MIRRGSGNQMKIVLFSTPKKRKERKKKKEKRKQGKRRSIDAGNCVSP